MSAVAERLRAVLPALVLAAWAAGAGAEAPAVDLALVAAYGRAELAGAIRRS